MKRYTDTGQRTIYPRPPSVRRQPDWLDGVRDVADAAFAVLLCFGGVGFTLLLIGSLVT